ncbi:MAG: glutamate--cysteine ligase [Pseudomonadota bacterium]
MGDSSATSDDRLPVSVLDTERLAHRIAALRGARKEHTLRGIRRGIEKESLRVSPKGHIAQTPHPAPLGSALTHPHITTDYSEALLEFITPAYEHVTDCLLFLADTHHFVYEQLGDELLWANSMPCVVGDELSIPIAQYGSSNLGRFKTVYRHGLWHRYGRHMQAIAGIHYNVSFPDNFWWAYRQNEGAASTDLQEFTSREYFALIRNYQKYVWLVAYLTGASPAMCASFLRGRSHDLASADGHTLYRPYATSLRLGDLGYSNSAQKKLAVSYNSLAAYVDSLDTAIRTPHPDFARIGVESGGEWKQLNGNILQMEAEFYGSIRPKCVPLPGERLVSALRDRGVEYVEMRSLDLNPFLPVGIDHETSYFMELFATFCLLHDSPPQGEAELAQNKANLRIAVNEGRSPDARIVLDGTEAPLREWGFALCEAMYPVARLLDEARPSSQGYSRSLAAQRRKFVDPAQTPSARVLNDLRERELSFFGFAMAQSLAARDHFRAQPLAPARREFFEHLAAESLEEQRELEAADSQPFADYVAAFYR